jgi:ATP-dependent RNA helicase DeaD
LLYPDGVKFTELDLKPEILRALDKMGYADLTPVQEQTFAHVLADRDLLAMAETGSGKTSACAIPLLQRIDPVRRTIQGLILVPTRELALQYVDEIDRIGRYLDVAPFAIYGGFPMDIQKAKLRDGVHVLVATPGRLIDHLYNSDLSLSDVRTLVLDEADEMLDMGFIDDVKFIMSCIIGEHQTLLFSATMPPDIEELTATYLRDPVHIKLNLEVVAPANIAHRFRLVSPGQRVEALGELLREPFTQVLIFINSRKSGEQLFKRLQPLHRGVEYIHGGLDQSRRTSIFNRFKKLDIKILLATDVAGRGLDFSHVSHVINYDFPFSTEAYTHRTGRTGRMGRAGVAITLVTERDLPSLDRLLRANSIEPLWDGAPPDAQQRKRAASRRPAAPPGGDRRRKSGAGPRRPPKPRQQS